MSAETKNNSRQPSPDDDLRLLPFSRRMAEQCPELWSKFVSACASARVAEPGISSETFLRRCTRAARRLARQTEIGGVR